MEEDGDISVVSPQMYLEETVNLRCIQPKQQKMFKLRMLSRYSGSARKHLYTYKI